MVHLDKDSRPVKVEKVLDILRVVIDKHEGMIRTVKSWSESKPSSKRSKY